MEKRKRQLENDFYEFFKDAFPIIHPGDELVDNWHIRYLCRILQEELERITRKEKKQKDIIINVPPRSLKSSIATVCWPAWCWMKNPQIKIISTSYSADLSIEHNMLCRLLIKSDWYQENWSDVFTIKDELDTKARFSNNKGGDRRATSTGGSIMGSGGDIIIIDDPLNPKKAASEIERQVANDYFDKTLSTRLDHPEIGVFIIIMQRLHEDDLVGHLLKKVDIEYQHICIPAELTPDVKPEYIKEYYKDGLFFPSRFSFDTLTRFRTDLGSNAYSGQLLQTPAGSGGIMIKSSWFGRFNLSELPVGTPWNFTIDGAYTKDKANNASVLLSYAELGNNLYIRSVSSVWKEFPDFIKFIKEFVYRNGYNRRSRIYIEPKSSGIPAAQSLKQQTDLNIIIDKAPTTDKVVRVNACLPYIEARRVFLLDGSSWIDSFLYETAMFPNAKEDGQVDCLTMACDKMQKPKARAKFKFGYTTQFNG